MTTKQFLETLSEHTEADLVFSVNADKQVAPGYHVTEIMSLSYDTVDCGGLVNHWRETVVQLQGPGQRDAATFMSVGKFLSIYDRVAPKVPIQPHAELRLEYGDAQQPAVFYHVAAIEATNGQLRVKLRAPGVTCKAKDRLSQLPANATGCCTPSEISASMTSSCC